MPFVKQVERVQRFVELLHEWYVLHRRELPWRDLWDLKESDRAYRVWISETMLQQTQVSRVIGSYKKFIQQFPAVGDLAKATNSEILIAWRGMGYNSRALRLRDGAREIVQRVTLRRAQGDNAAVMVSSTNHDTLFPHTIEDLIAIPGIGAYTAGAIRTFAFDLPTPAMDVNIRRILHRVFVGPENVDGTWSANDATLTKLLETIIGAWIAAGHRGSDLYSALMDYGSMVQTKNHPKWAICVLTEKGIMKATPKNWKPPVRGASKERLKKEPGRTVGTTYIPNRIFRGRIVEVLRDHPDGLNFEEIGKWISPDHREELYEWLDQLIKKLIQDGMVMEKKKKYFLAE